jgi:hypothetical protein
VTTDKCRWALVRLPLAMIEDDIQKRVERRGELLEKGVNLSIETGFNDNIPFPIASSARPNECEHAYEMKFSDCF